MIFIGRNFDATVCRVRAIVAQAQPFCGRARWLRGDVTIQNDFRESETD
jgi:hypothetical protein